MSESKTKESSGIIKSTSIRELDLISDIRSTILIQSPRGGRYILWATVVLVFVLIVWAAISEVDEVTRANGKVIPSSHIQIVQNLEGGILEQILVSVGNMVAKGQPLLRLSDTRYSAQYSDNQRQLHALEVKIARLKASISSRDLVIPEEISQKYPDIVQREQDLFQTEQEQLEAKISILKYQAKQRAQELEELQAKVKQYRQSKSLLNQEMKMTQPLVAQGAVSEVEILRLRRQLNEISGLLTTTELQIPTIRSKYEEAQRKIEEEQLSFQKKAKQELNQTVSDKNTLVANTVTLQDKLQRTVVTSPVKGTVNQVLINTVGGVIQPGMDLIEIVPLEDSLLIEAKVIPADIAFLHPGQPAVVKFTAYDFTVYGGLTAKLEHISADSITDEKGDSYYLIRLRTEKNYLGKESSPNPIIPGMLASVDILTGKKTILNYLLKPILRAKSQALRER